MKGSLSGILSPSTPSTHLQLPEAAAEHPLPYAGKDRLGDADGNSGVWARVWTFLVEQVTGSSPVVG